jgi:hypothetical protein
MVPFSDGTDSAYPFIKESQALKRRFAFNEHDLLVLFDALDFEFNYFMNPKHRDLNKAAEAYSMARRIVSHQPGRLSGYWVESGNSLETYERKCPGEFKKNMQEWRTTLQSLAKRNRNT